MNQIKPQNPAEFVRMTIVDRYLLFLFLRTFLICFVSFSGLYIVIQMFSNLEDLVEIAQVDGWPKLFQEFYLPRIAELFDKTAGMTTLVAAIFSISLLQRRREMTAIEAAGITKARILRPVFLSAIVIIGLTIANRELVIPKVRDSLVRTAQRWSDQGQIDFTVQEDLETGVVLRGDQLFIDERRISEADIQVPSSPNSEVTRIQAERGIVQPATEMHPAGIWLHQVSLPKDIDSLSSIENEAGETQIFTPSDQNWLTSGQCFVRCNFEVEQMAYGTKLANYQTTPAMMKELRKPRKWFGHNQQINVHTRLLKPVLDITLLMLGLPLVIGGIERNVFVSAGIVFWVVVAVQLTSMACHSLGASSVIRPAAMAAWIPVGIFLPMAVVAMRRLKR